MSAEEFVSAAREALQRATALTRKDDLCHELGQIIDAGQLDRIDAQLAFKALYDMSNADAVDNAPKFEEMLGHIFAKRNIAQDLFVRLGCRRILP